MAERQLQEDTPIMPPCAQRFARVVTGLAMVALIVPSAVASAQTPTAAEPDLAGLKTYMVDHARAMKSGTAELLGLSQQYHDLAQQANDDYSALWKAHGKELVPWLEQSRSVWAEKAHGNYELIEGMVAGIPSLAHFDVWIDAGPSGEDDPADAQICSSPLPMARCSIGRATSSTTSPSRPCGAPSDSFVGVRVDLDGDGTVEPGEALPDANVLLGSAQALDAATAELGKARSTTWQPNAGDAFTALVVMIPTMSGYFEEWKHLVIRPRRQKHEPALHRQQPPGRRARHPRRDCDVTYDTFSPLVDRERSCAGRAQIEVNSTA